MSNSLKRAEKDKQSEFDNLVTKKGMHWRKKASITSWHVIYIWYLLAWDIDMIRIWLEPQIFAFPNLGNVIFFHIFGVSS